MKILKMIELVLVITICALLLFSQFYASRCIVLGGVSAALTQNGIYCQVWVESVPQYFPLRLLENPPAPTLFDRNGGAQG